MILAGTAKQKNRQQTLLEILFFFSFDPCFPSPANGIGVGERKSFGMAVVLLPRLGLTGRHLLLHVPVADVLSDPSALGKGQQG